MFHQNHFIFKIFDGKNFFDFDNTKKHISKKGNNSCSIDGSNYELILGIYYRIE